MKYVEFNTLSVPSFLNDKEVPATNSWKTFNSRSIN